METTEITKVENTVTKIQCSGCGRFFSGQTVHERHRVGDYSSRTSRRCLTDEEMRTKGMDTEKKNVRIVIEGKATYQEHDVWFDSAGREILRNYFINRLEQDAKDD